jgi:hypothetical protein
MAKWKREKEYAYMNPAKAILLKKLKQVDLEIDSRKT